MALSSNSVLETLVAKSVPILVAVAAVLAALIFREWMAKKPAKLSREDSSTSAATALKEIQQLPLQILFATTTGTARRLSEILRKELFALNVSGFHFDVKVTDLASYNVETLSDERHLVFLLPTWTGGVPASTAAGLHSHVRDLVTDFRVDRDALKGLVYGVFGLGNAEYDSNWCRAAVEVDAGLGELGARQLVEMCKGDDSSDMEGQFKAWLHSLIPALCEEYARECGSDSEEQAPSSSAGCGPGGCGTGSAGSGANGGSGLKQQRSWEEEEDAASRPAARGTNGSKPNNSNSIGSCGPACACSNGNDGGAGANNDSECCGNGNGEQDGKEWLPLKEHRRRKRAEKEAAERAAERQKRLDAASGSGAAPAAATASASIHDNSATAAIDAENAETEEYTEEDAINDRMLRESDEMLRRMEREGAAAAAVADYVDSDDEDDEHEGHADGQQSSKPKSKFSAKAGNVSGGAGSAASGGYDGGGGDGAVVDLEDIGSLMRQASEERKKEEEESAARASTASSSAALPNLSSSLEMVTPAQRRALTKEGYKIIGTHSAVKLCRWTKAQLRGRGGCYKHTFYGIQSYQCMEATPSLACANKCTFCWRHHKNPVGREWRWKVDAPEDIVNEAVGHHVSMINAFKGTPGVKQDRWQEAFTVRHCALSLVGEPIMYPHINKLIRLLHGRKISSFLVTNAQFPECISALEPVTQLYVSIDAATKDTLRAIDRPLFSDFWERFLASLDALRTKGQRTVFRMTLIQGQNMNTEHLASYVDLINRGQPALIEIKGVTWCGESKGSNLSMANVPWHAEVKAYCEALCEKTGGAYELACEHAHSCCVLLAQKKFKIGGVWHTHIDYDRFHALAQRYYDSNGKETFTSMDYLAPTPAWATYNAAEGGFDPIEMRWRRKQDGGVAEIEYKASESGCG